MNLESKTSAFSLNVSVEKISHIGHSLKSYDIFLENPSLIPGGIEIPLDEKGKDFISGLHEGNDIIIIRKGNNCVAVYGPVKGGNLYTYNQVNSKN